LAENLGAFSRVLPYVYAAVGIVIVWQIALVLTGADPSLLPPPLLTGETLVEMVVSGEIFEHAGMSLGRVLSAWLMSACVAIPLGLAMGRFRMFERIVDPVVELFRPISPLAWIPMAIIWFGIGESGKIFVIFIATFFPTILNTVAGVKGVDPVLIRAGRVLGCNSEWAIFRKIILPAALPSIVVGLRISFGTGWAAIIAAELVAAQSGLGYLIADGMEILRSDLVFVGMAVIGILGVIFDSIFRFLHHRYGWVE
jgi:ABC-type nitrate/sulfonate/bicarbonate transport system permease component